ncbi:MAG: acyl carrier protein [Pseudomonadota bacterium]
MTTAAQNLLAEAVEIDAGDVPPDAAIGTFEAWDSLAHIRLFAALEARIGRQITADEAVSLQSLGAVAAILENAD